MSTTQTPRKWVELSVLLDRMGMRQADLARASGISPQYLNDMIQGRRPPGARARIKIAKALKVPQAVLVPPFDEGKDQ